MEDKYLSIITNFGCHYSCPYCIVKNNNINVPYTSVSSLDSRFVSAILNNKINVVSVSGGGDPLHNYQLHIDYYKKLFDILSILNIPLEMHTSYVNTLFPVERCGRVVYHLHNMKQIPTIHRYGSELVRVVFVVTDDFTNEKIDKIVEMVKNNNYIDELSFRQMVDADYKNTDYCMDYLRLGHKKNWWYIEQCDYNLYYVEGEIFTKYSDIGKSHET